MVILGILSGSAFGAHVPLWCPWVLALVLVLSAAFIRKKPLVVSCMVLLSVLSLGFFIEVLSERRLERQFPETAVEYEAVLMSSPVEAGRIVRCELLVVGRGAPFRLRASILRDTLTHRYRHLKVGDGIRAYSVMQSVPSKIGGG